jgi:acyl-CoA hydrolase
MRVFFHAPSYAEARGQGSIEFCQLAYSSIQRYLADSNTRIDTLVLQVGKPGADGRCSLGPAVEFVPTVMRRNVRIFAVLNANVPDVPGSIRIPMECFDCYAESDAPLGVYDAGSANEISDRIAQHLLALIPSGATLQIGLGKVPSLLLRAAPGVADCRRRAHSRSQGSGVLAAALRHQLRYRG